MTEIPVSRRSVHLGEVFALALGFGFSSLAVAARVYTKIRLTNTMGKEDYLSVLAWLFFLAYIGIAVAIGKHAGSAEHIAHLSSIESAIYLPIMMTVKVSILLQYITLFVTHRRTAFHYTVQGLIWTNVLYYTIASVIFVTECSPIQKLWKPDIPGHCFSRHNGGVASGIFNIISDFSILILPLPIIWRLQMSWNKKSRVLAVFGMGLFACIASVLRLVYQVELTHTGFNTPTYQLDIDRIGLWAFAEIAIGILVGCLPVLPRFFKHFASKEAGSSSRFANLSSVSRTLWRMVFRKPTTPESSRDETSSYYRRKFLKRRKGSMSTRAPYIETLDLTRNSLELAEKYLPRLPSPVLEKGSSAAASRTGTYHAERDEDMAYGQIADVGKALSAEWV